MKKLTALFMVMAVVLVTTASAQIKINKYGAVYAGAYTLDNINNHADSEVPGLYVYGKEYKNAAVLFPGNSGVGLFIDGRNAPMNTSLISTACQSTSNIFSCTVNNFSTFVVEGNGYVYANNYITMQSANSMSKSTLKSKPLTSPLQKVMKLNGGLFPVEKIKGVSAFDASEKDLNKFMPITESSYRIGIDTKELEELVPEVVYKNGKGETGVAYNELVGLLVEAIKELQGTVAEMQDQIDNIQPAGVTSQVYGNIELHQNVPNPFDQETKIRFNIPPEVSSASLYFYNMQGNQLKSIPVNERGENEITIHASEFTPGMYIYTLVADGKEVVSKRMILTK